MTFSFAFILLHDSMILPLLHFVCCDICRFIDSTYICKVLLIEECVLSSGGSMFSFLAAVLAVILSLPVMCLLFQEFVLSSDGVQLIVTCIL